MKQIMDKFTNLTSYIETDENGNEFKRPWTLQEFLIEHFFIVIGVIIGAIFF